MNTLDTGTNGEFCVCYKPSHTELKQANWDSKDISEDIPSSSLQSDTKLSMHNGLEMKEIETVAVELYQSDFEWGTYRIRKGGTYTIMEV